MVLSSGQEGNMIESDEVGWGGVMEPHETIPCECAECGAGLGLGMDGTSGVLVIGGIEAEPDLLRKERGSYYGDPTINHASIGAIWAGILVQALSSGRWRVGETLPPELVCLMMVGVKLSREAYRHKDDNIVDAKVYIDFVDEMSDRG